MKPGTILPDWIFQRYLENHKAEFVLHEAQQILKRRELSGRSEDLRKKNAIEGIALQYALFDHCESNLGYTVSRNNPELDGSYHLDALLERQNLHFGIDVKGRWDGRWFSQSDSERALIAQTKDEILYVCIDVFPTRLVAKGECFAKDLTCGTTNYVTKFSDIL